MLNDRLQSQLKELRLSGLALTLEVRCQEARGNNLSHAEFLELVFQDEVLVGQPPSRMRATVVSFTPGARTGWHYCPSWLRRGALPLKI